MNINPTSPTWFFNGHGILKELLDSLIRRFKDEIENIPAEQYLVLNYDELKAKYLESLNMGDFPTLLNESKHIVSKSDHKEMVEYRDYNRTREREVRFITMKMGIAFNGDKRYFLHRPQQALNITQIDRERCPKGYLLENELHFDYDFPEQDTTSLEKNFEHDIELVNRYLQWCKSEIDKHNNEVPTVVNSIIDNRLAECKKDDQFLKNLKYPLKKQDQVPIAIQLPTRPVIVKPIQSTTIISASNFPIISNSDYEMILQILQSMSVAMERSPKVFAGLEEEEIRDFFLVILNSHFSGQATGETFNRKGKTDILIRSGDSNVFIGECKFWSGEKLFHETIDQLLSYVTWRDTKTAILLFNRNKNFSGVLNKIEDSIKTHACFRKSVTLNHQDLKIESILSFEFCHKDDPLRTLTLTILAYDIPT
jgi:hypothetical protein